MNELIYDKLKNEEAKLLFKFIEKHHKYIKLFINAEDIYEMESTKKIDTLSTEEKDFILSDFKELRDKFSSCHSEWWRGKNNQNDNVTVSFDLEFKKHFTMEIFNDIKTCFDI